MEEEKDSYRDFEMLTDTDKLDNECPINNDSFDNKPITIYGETVLCSDSQLQNLPQSVLTIYQQYQQGLLPKVSKETVTELLSKWFQNEPISELPIIPDHVDSGQSASYVSKRRRLPSDV